MGLKIYTYKNCGTCRKALKWLDEQGVTYANVPIREQPPTKTELRKMLGYVDGEIKKIFNTSGGDYKALDMKEKLPKMSAKEAIDLLNSNGNLVKRPFLLSKTFGAVGFSEDSWREFFAKA